MENTNVIDFASAGLTFDPPSLLATLFTSYVFTPQFQPLNTSPTRFSHISPSTNGGKETQTAIKEPHRTDKRILKEYTIPTLENELPVKYAPRKKDK